MRTLVRPASPKPSRRRGAAAAELVFILSLLVLIVLGGIDFGRFAYTYIAVINAARAGAAFGSFNPYDGTTYGAWQKGVKQAVVDDLSQMAGYDPSLLTVVTTGTTETGTGLKRVEVDVTYQFRTFTTWPGIPNNFPLAGKVVLRQIR